MVARSFVLSRPDGLKPWQPLPEEKQLDFLWFQIWLFLPVEERSSKHSVSHAYQVWRKRVNPPEPPKDSIYKKWEHKFVHFHWEERGKEFDKHINRNFLTELENEERKHAEVWAQRRTQIRDTAFNQYTKIIQLAEKMVKTGNRLMDRIDDDTEFKIGDVTAMVRAASKVASEADKMARLAADFGRSFAPDHTPSSEVDLSNYSDEELELLKGGESHEKIVMLRQKPAPKKKAAK